MSQDNFIIPPLENKNESFCIRIAWELGHTNF